MVFSWFSVNFILRIFEFVVLLVGWLFCLSPKFNLSEKFYQVWALRRWDGRHNLQADSQLSLKLLGPKVERLVAVWWRYAKVVGMVFCCGHTVDEWQWLVYRPFKQQRWHSVILSSSVTGYVRGIVIMYIFANLIRFPFTLGDLTLSVVVDSFDTLTIFAIFHSC